MISKQFNKLEERNFFEKLNRNMNTKVSTITLCDEKRESGALTNPRGHEGHRSKTIFGQ